MAVSAQIAEGTVQIVVKGMAALQAQLSSIQKSFTKVSQSAGAINQVASSTFSQTTSLIKGLVAAADPLGFLHFEMALVRVSVQLGRTFVPLLREATKWINKAADYLNGLSDSTRESVMQFTKWALIVSGSIVVGGKLIGIVAGITSTFGALVPLVTGAGAALLKVASIVPGLGAGFSSLGGLVSGAGAAFWKVLGFLGPWGRIAVIVAGVVTALLGLNAAAKSTDGIFGNISKYAQKAWETISSLWGKLTDAVGPPLEKLYDTASAIFEKISEAFGEAFLNVLPSLEKYFGVVVGIAEKILNNVAALFGKLEGGVDSSTIEKFGAVASKVFNFIGGLVSSYFDKMAKFWTDIYPYVERFGTVALKVFGMIGSATEKIFAALKRAWERLEPVLAPLLERFNRAFGADKEDLILRITKAFVEFAEMALPIVEKVFGGMVDRAVTLIDVLSKGFTTIFSWVKDKLNEMINQLNTLIIVANKLNPVSQIELVPNIGPRPKALGEALGPILRDEGGGDFGVPEDAVKSKPAPKAKDNEATNKGDANSKFNGQALGQVRITGIAEAMRAAQQATVPTRESTQLTEIAKGQMQQVEVLKQIEKNTSGEVPGGFGR